MREDARDMEMFLRSVERRALRMAGIVSGDMEEALDIVQDAMLRFVDKYGSHRSEAWKPLFYKILQNRIKDWLRKERFRSRFRGWIGRTDPADDPSEDTPFDAPDTEQRNPEEEVAGSFSLAGLEAAVKTLPLRQQQAFLLRAYEELSLTETARAMSCSEGSVKTHFARAVRRLRGMLEGTDHEG